MSKNAKITLAVITGSVVLLFLLALAAAGGYAISQKYLADKKPETSIAISAAEEFERVEENLPPTTTVTESSEVEEEVTEKGDSVDESAAEDAPSVEVVPTTEDEPTSEPVRQEEEETEAGKRIPPELDNEELELLIEVWDIVGDGFDGSLPTDDEVINGAIRGSLELLEDDHTRFIPRDIANQLREQIEGSFEGIGAFVDITEEGFLIIVRPMEGQPADLAGLKGGDLITHVDGVSVLGKSIDQITAEVKGPKGTEVTLTIRRESSVEPFDVTITRKLIEIPIVAAELLDEGIAYIRLTAFSGVADAQVTEELEELLEMEPAGLIFDLRDNPGGFLNQAVSVSDIFLPEGIILYERDSAGFEEIFRAKDGQIGESIPLVVLVNAGSASASEIVAGAVQDNGRGVLIGEQTFGKGSVQQSHILSDGSELRVTIARWYTPDNVSIDKEGILPDIEVESPEEFNTENDTQMQEAIDYLLDRD